MGLFWYIDKSFVFPCFFKGFFPRLYISGDLNVQVPMPPLSMSRRKRSCFYDRIPLSLPGPVLPLITVFEVLKNPGYTPLRNSYVSRDTAGGNPGVQHYPGGECCRVVVDGRGKSLYDLCAVPHPDCICGLYHTNVCHEGFGKGSFRMVCQVRSKDFLVDMVRLVSMADEDHLPIDGLGAEVLPDCPHGNAGSPARKETRRYPVLIAGNAMLFTPLSSARASEFR